MNTKFTQYQLRKLSSLRSRKILILGGGREGLSTYKFLREVFPDLPLTVADSNPALPDSPAWQKFFTNDYLLTHICGDHYLGTLTRFDLIFRTPGLPPTTPELVAASKAGVEFTSNLDWFFRLARGTIIGVTGTKGKSTTSSLIAHVFRANGYPTLLLGNIGVAPLSYVTQTSPKSFTILELSAHQLQSLKTSPHIAVVQNVTSEHLDYYRDTAAYVAAKSPIVRFQKKSDFYVYCDEFTTCRDYAQLTRATKLIYGLKDTPEHLCFIRGHALYYRASSQNEVSVINLRLTKLLGKHNYYNIMPAVIIAERFSLSHQQIEQAIYSFTPLRHRLEYVATVNHVSYYNDSLSTTPEATLAAIKAFAGKPLHLFVGGHERHQDFTALAKSILKNDIKSVFLFPPTGKRLKRTLTDLAIKTKKLVPDFYDINQLKQAIEKVHQIAKPGDIVLLSPSAASFGMFKDYADRGDQFCQLVKDLL